MTLFGKKKKEQNAAPSIPAPVAVPAAPAPTHSKADVSHVLLHPRVTEKATMHSEGGVYTFDVANSATKRSVAQAVHALYKVTPRKVAIVSVRAKERRNMRTGRVGKRAGGKKAYVFLKSGDSITVQ